MGNNNKGHIWRYDVERSVWTDETSGWEVWKEGDSFHVLGLTTGASFECASLCEAWDKAMELKLRIFGEVG